MSSTLGFIASVLVIVRWPGKTRCLPSLSMVVWLLSFVY